MRQDTAFLAGPDPLEAPHSGWLLRVLFTVVATSLVVAGALAAWMVADTVVEVLGGRGGASPDPLAQYSTQGQSGAVVEDPEGGPNVWDQHGPLNVLLLGLDESDCANPVDTLARRTDTIILVRVDPQTKQAAMLSIPRDLYVFIPGFGAKKINTAHVLGNKPGDPDSGPALLEQVLAENLQLSAQRYIRIDFQSFKALIDEGLGGLDMDLPPSPTDPTVSLVDTDYPDGHCGTMTVRFTPGRQHLDGAQVLQYARSRHSTSDFDRSRRQMEVLMAIKDKASSPAILTRLPKLLPALLRTVDTDLTPTEILSLARMARGVKSSDVITLRMDESIVYPDSLVIDGVTQSILRHNQAAFDQLRFQFLNLIPPTPTPPPVPTAGATATP